MLLACSQIFESGTFNGENLNAFHFKFFFPLPQIGGMMVMQKFIKRVVQDQEGKVKGWMHFHYDLKWQSNGSREQCNTIVNIFIWSGLT